MSAAQLFLQLGIAGALLYVVYRLGDKMLDNQAAAQKRQLAVHAAAEVKRTKAIGDGFAAITSRLDDHGERLTEIKTTIDEHLSTKEAIKQALDEVSGVHEAAVVPIAGDESELDLEPPRPLAVVRKTPAGGYHVRPGTKGGG